MQELENFFIKKNQLNCFVLSIFFPQHFSDPLPASLCSPNFMFSLSLSLSLPSLSQNKNENQNKINNTKSTKTKVCKASAQGHSTPLSLSRNTLADTPRDFDWGGMCGFHWAQGGARQTFLPGTPLHGCSKLRIRILSIDLATLHGRNTLCKY